MSATYSNQVPTVIESNGRNYRLFTPSKVEDLKRVDQVLKHPIFLPHYREIRWPFPWSRKMRIPTQVRAEELVEINADRVATVDTSLANITPWEMSQNYWWI